MLSDWIKKSAKRRQEKDLPPPPSPVPFRSEGQQEKGEVPSAPAPQVTQKNPVPEKTASAPQAAKKGSEMENYAPEPVVKKVAPTQGQPAGDRSDSEQIAGRKNSEKSKNTQRSVSPKTDSRKQKPGAEATGSIAGDEGFFNRKTLAFRRRKMLSMRLGEGVSMPAEDPRILEDPAPLPPDARVIVTSTPPPLERIRSEDASSEARERVQERAQETGSGEAHQPSLHSASNMPASPAKARVKQNAAAPSKAQSPKGAAKKPEKSRPAEVQATPAPRAPEEPASSARAQSSSAWGSSEGVHDPIEEERQRRAAERARRTRREQTTKRRRLTMPSLNFKKQRAETLRRRAEKRAEKRSRQQEKMEKILQAAKEEASGITQQEAKEESKRRLPSRSRSQGKRKIQQIHLPSLDIGSSALRLYDPQSGNYYQRFIPDGIIVHGLLQEPTELSEEARQLFLDAGVDKKMRFSVKNRLLQVRAIHLPSGSEKEIESALEVNAAAIVSPMKPEHTTVDYYQMTRSGVEVPLLVVAADKRMITSYNEALRSAGLQPVSAAAGPLVSQKALVIPRSTTSTHALVDIGAETTSFLVASGPDVYFMRVLDIGGNDFTRALLSEGCGWGLAEKKKTEGLLSQKADIQRALRPVADRLTQELLNTKKLFESSSLGQKRPIAGGTLIGGGSLLPGLAREIEYLLSLPNQEPQPRYSGLQPVLFTSSRGMAEEESISLLPRSGKSLFSRGKKKKRSSWLDPILGALLLSVVVSFALAWFSLGLVEKNTALEGEIQLLEQVQEGSQKETWSNLLPWAIENQKVNITAGQEIVLESPVSGPEESERLEKELLESNLALSDSQTERDFTRRSWIWEVNVGGEG